MRFNVKDVCKILIIFFSSFLLGIWAVRHTIALRNILLFVTAFLSLIYLYWILRNWQSYFSRIYLFKVNFLPVGLILSMFFWVIVHYIFFSQFPEKQLNELSSTWLRAFIASIIGFACALVFCQHQRPSYLLWLGLIASFLVLIYQYIPKAIANGSLFAPDYFGTYIYWAKFNGVLAGIILFSGTLGLLIDSLRQLPEDPSLNDNISSRFNKVILPLILSLGLLLPIYSFVFIFNAKNGVGVAAILLFFWFLVGGIYLLVQSFRKNRNKKSTQKWIRWIFIYLSILLLFSSFVYLHAKNNPGWESLIEDIRFSAQIDNHDNWKNVSKYGYPNREDGSRVTTNTYERVAWGVFGLRLIADRPLGNGVLRDLPNQMRQVGIEFNDSSYTHSAWIDLGLSYGWPGALLIPSALLLCLLACIKRYSGPYRATVASLAVSFLILYAVGEYAFQHGIEILLFISTFLASLVLLDDNSASDQKMQRLWLK